MRLKLISCAVMSREMQKVVAESVHSIDLELLSMGLHEVGCKLMRERLQQAVDQSSAGPWETILLGYGLCNFGLIGLEAGRVPLVIPRAHDCITLLLGSRDKYLQYFQENPGVYFKSSGWIEGKEQTDEFSQLSISRQNSLDLTLEEFIAKYGEENGQYLFEAMAAQDRHYQQLTFIEMGVEPDDRYELQTRAEAEERGWRFEKVRGSLDLLQRLVNGPWEEPDFLVVPPGWKTVTDYSSNLIHAEPPA